MDSSNNKYKLAFLLLRLVEGDISDAEMDSLRKWLASSPKAQAEYLSFIQDYAFIKTRMESEPGLLSSSRHSSEEGIYQSITELLEYERSGPALNIPKPEPELQLQPVQKVVYAPLERAKLNKFQKSFLAASAAAIFFVVLFIRLAPVSVDVVAQLQDQVNASWDVGMEAPDENGEMVSSSYRLTSGCVDIWLKGGAKVTVESPAEFSLLDGGKMELFEGRIYAVVSQEAVGFTVLAAGSEIVDLGTEFGVEVDESSSTQLHVTKGEVQLHSLMGDGKPINVKEGHARKVSSSGEVQVVSLASSKFVSNIHSPKQTDWRGKLDIGDRLVEYWRFDGDYNAYVDASHDGVLKGTGNGVAQTRFVRGKFGQGVSLGNSDSVNQAFVIVGGKEKDFEFAGKAMSVSAWYTTESLYAEFQGLLGKGLNKGWRIARESDKSLIKWSTDGIEMDKVVIGDGKLAKQDGSWHHVAAILDAKDGSKLYIDGQLVGTAPGPKKTIDGDTPMYIGRCPTTSGRGWDGSIDEVAVWGRVLKENEVHAIWKEGVGRTIESLLTGK